MDTGAIIQMKKRKSPIVLVTLLAVMASVAFGLQYAWSKSAGPGAEQQPQVQATDTPPVGQPRQAESKEAVANSLKGALSGPTAVEPMEPGRPSGPGGPGGPAGPSILNPSVATANRKPEKPKPNPTSTSAQWYLDDKKG